MDKFANQLDWNLLRTFMVIVQERSITLAAHRLSVTQPSVSAALRRLEERLDRRLIERGGAASFQPTAAGEVYRHCADIYRLVTALPDALDAAHSAVQGIVTPAPERPCALARAAGADRRLPSGIPAGPFPHQARHLRRHPQPAGAKNAALGVVSAPDARPSAVRRCSSRTCCTTPPPAAPSGELRDAPVIGYEDEQTGAPLAALAVHRIRCGLEGATVAEGLDCDAVAALVRAGAGIGAPPRRYAEADPALAALPLEPVTLPVYLVRHEQAGASRADQSFLQFLASRLPAAGPPRAASD